MTASGKRPGFTDPPRRSSASPLPCLSHQDRGHRQEDSEDQEHGERAGVRKVPVHEHALRDLVPEHLSVGAAHEIRDHVGTESGNEDDEEGHDESAPDSRRKIEESPEAAGTRSCAASRRRKSNSRLPRRWAGLRRAGTCRPSPAAQRPPCRAASSARSRHLEARVLVSVRPPGAAALSRRRFG